MGTRRFALIFGIFYLLIGLLGLIPAFISAVDFPNVTVDALEGNLLGIFPVNIVHTLVHLLFGVLGIAAYRSFDGARTFARVAGITFALLTVMGLIPGLNVLFGLAPLHGADVVLHLLSAAVALYFGYAYRPTMETTRV